MFGFPPSLKQLLRTPFNWSSVKALCVPSVLIAPPAAPDPPAPASTLVEIQVGTPPHFLAVEALPAAAATLDERAVSISLVNSFADFATL